jgi:protein arginine N-methyltransferase 5
MSSWDGSATISTFLTLEELSSAPGKNDKKHETPVLEQAAEARDKGYDAICLPLTTEKWKKRWSDMCLLPTGSDRDTQILAEQQAEAWRSKPCFLQDEVTITRLGEWDFVNKKIENLD